MSDVVIVDSSVFNKLYLNEAGRETAVALFEAASVGKIQLRAPQLLVYEVLATAHHYAIDCALILNFLDSQIGKTLVLTEPTKNHWKKAFEISNQGHKKSGYPSLYDAIYHAIAIVEKGQFLTADKRHYEKTKFLGSIALLD